MTRTLDRQLLRHYPNCRIHFRWWDTEGVGRSGRLIHRLSPALAPWGGVVLSGPVPVLYRDPSVWDRVSLSLFRRVYERPVRDRDAAAPHINPEIAIEDGILRGAAYFILVDPPYPDAPEVHAYLLRAWDKHTLAGVGMNRQYEEVLEPEGGEVMVSLGSRCRSGRYGNRISVVVSPVPGMVRGVGVP